MYDLVVSVTSREVMYRQAGQRGTQKAPHLEVLDVQRGSALDAPAAG